jgi:hypothetical protein
VSTPAKGLRPRLEDGARVLRLPAALYDDQRDARQIRQRSTAQRLIVFPSGYAPRCISVDSTTGVGSFLLHATTSSAPPRIDSFEVVDPMIKRPSIGFLPRVGIRQTSHMQWTCPAAQRKTQKSGQAPLADRGK